jgi:hypothetical protein
MSASAPASVVVPIKASESEGILLGALLDADGPLLKSNAFELAEGSGLSAEDFSDLRVRNYWGVALRLAQHRRPVDASTVFMSARASGQVADADFGWLQQLQAHNALDRSRFSSVAESFRQASRGLAAAVRLEAIARDLRARRVSPATIAGNLEGLASTLNAQWAPDHTGAEDLAEIISEWEFAGQSQSGARPLVRQSGVAILDEVMRGWSPTLNLLIGQPSVGKSAIEATCIWNALKAGRRPGLFGIEDGTRWLTKRVIAMELGIPVADVGVAALNDEQRQFLAQLEPELHERLKNLVTFKFSSIHISELRRRATHWIKNLGVDEIWVDHAGLIEHQRERGEELRFALGRSLLYLRQLGERHQVPLNVLMHTSRPDQNDREERPPRMSEIAESSYAERHAFKILGLWLRRGELRGTVVKNKEGKRDVTFTLPRAADAAMVQSVGGEVVDLGKEAAAERGSRDAQREAQKKAQRDARWQEAEERRKKKAAEKEAQRAAAAQTKAPEQASLLGENVTNAGK